MNLIPRSVFVLCLCSLILSAPGATADKISSCDTSQLIVSIWLSSALQLLKGHRE